MPSNPVWNKNSTIVTLEFRTGEHARHFLGWYLDGGGDQHCARSTEIHLGEEDDGTLAVSHGGRRWPDHGFGAYDDEDDDHDHE